MGKLKPLFDSLSTAAVRGARHADVNLPNVSVNLKNVFGDVKTGTKGLEDTKFHADAPNKPRTKHGADGGTNGAVTQQEFDEYVDALRTRDAKYGSPEAQDFQTRHAGDSEYEIGAAGESVWADGLRYDPDQGGVIVEAKFVEKPGGSSIYEGTAPSFILDNALTEFDGEIGRYATAILDPSNPLKSLDVVVSTPTARDFLGDRIASLLKDSTAPWTIRVGD